MRNARSREAESGPDARRARRSDRSIAGGYVRIRTAEARQRRWSAIGFASKGNEDDAGEGDEGGK